MSTIVNSFVNDKLHNDQLVYDFVRQKYRQIYPSLTLPVPSLLIHKPDTKGGGGRPDPLLSQKTLGPVNLKFCRVLETSPNVLEILK